MYVDGHPEHQQPRLVEGLHESCSLHLIIYFILLAYKVGACCCDPKFKEEETGPEG